MHNPFSNNPLHTRNDLQEAVRSLFAPLKPFFSPGFARVNLGYSSALYDNHAAALEGFARPLWGLVPLVAGGGEFADWEMYRRGLSNGTDPHHPEYWGEPRNKDQRLVEMAAIGWALACIPNEIWEPLNSQARAHLVHWLQRDQSR